MIDAYNPCRFSMDESLLECCSYYPLMMVDFIVQSRSRSTPYTTNRKVDKISLLSDIKNNCMPHPFRHRKYANLRGHIG